MKGSERDKIPQGQGSTRIGSGEDGKGRVDWDEPLGRGRVATPAEPQCFNSWTLHSRCKLKVVVVSGPGDELVVVNGRGSLLLIQGHGQVVHLP